MPACNRSLPAPTAVPFNGASCFLADICHDGATMGPRWGGKARLASQVPSKSLGTQQGPACVPRSRPGPAQGRETGLHQKMGVEQVQTPRCPLPAHQGFREGSS